MTRRPFRLPERHPGLNERASSHRRILTAPENPTRGSKMSNKDSVKDKVEAEIKDAMKSRNKDRLSALRMIKSDLLTKEKESADPLDDDAAEQAIRKMMNKYKKAKEEYTSLGKQDEAERYARDLEVIESFLSAPMMSEDAIKEALKALVATLGATEPRDFGKVMNAFMTDHSNADGKTVSSLLKAMLDEQGQE